MCNFPEEDASNCPEDCAGVGTGSVCGNGICETANGENCFTCREDCAAKYRGNQRKRYCCGDNGSSEESTDDPDGDKICKPWCEKNSKPWLPETTSTLGNLGKQFKCLWPNSCGGCPQCDNFGAATKQVRNKKRYHFKFGYTECSDNRCNTATKTCLSDPVDDITWECGDGDCSVHEDGFICPYDCGEVVSECGNGVCETGEDCMSCKKDCKGRTNGNKWTRFCCGDGTPCTDFRCSNRRITCTAKDLGDSFLDEDSSFDLPY